MNKNNIMYVLGITIVICSIIVGLAFIIYGETTKKHQPDGEYTVWIGPTSFYNELDDYSGDVYYFIDDNMSSAIKISGISKSPNDLLYEVHYVSRRLIKGDSTPDVEVNISNSTFKNIDSNSSAIEINN